MHGMLKPRSKAKANTTPRRSRKSVPAAATASAPIFRLTPRLDRALDKLVRMTGRPKSYHTRRALERYVEDTYDYLIGVEALRTSRKSYSSEEARRRLGLSTKA